jgi:CDP-diacylglycerol--glycerol-3-phosphate 3-phosphatidyltransferase
VEHVTEKKQHLTLTDQMRVLFRGILEPIAAFLNSLGLMPNTMTIIGLTGNTLGSYLLARGDMTLGGVIILLMGPIDALDGTMARLRGMEGQFGAFVDSVTDRYSELVIMAGLLFYYVQQGNKLASMLVFTAAAGSVLVSYIRSRGQSLGWDTKVGILTRMERYLVLAPALIFNAKVGRFFVILAQIGDLLAKSEFWRRYCNLGVVYFDFRKFACMSSNFHGGMDLSLLHHCS